MDLDVIDRRGVPVEKLTVADGVFSAAVKAHLLHQVIRMQLANRRRGTASTKTRGEVSGGGRKPWRQKGTGRARQGSTRSPHWRSGGVAFGPKPRDYSYLLPKKVRHAALRSAVALKMQEGLFKVLDHLDIPEPKTKQVVALLNDLGLTTRTLILRGGENANLQLAARNLPHVKVLPVEGLNVYDLLYYDHVICPKDALAKMQERLAS
ncbi:MAG: 50S ribosomal protein L4 [Nitrospinae bacterium]|nr:50S ribosomal protein L4 [Nitrospinota bacterium]